MKILNQYITDDCALYNADSVEAIKMIPDNSVGLEVYSPPFSSLYTYSNSDRDLGNSKTDDEFFTHFGFLIDDLLRILKPGRIMAVHCMNLPTSKQNDGYIGIKDFRGQLIKAFQDHGFIYHSEVCIWKNPVTAMQRTKALGLLHKQLKKDSCMSRMGIPDYVVFMRKPGENPDRVTHTNQSFPVSQWQEYASPIWDEYNSPVWWDINQSDTLNARSAKDEESERHICPLQLPVIERIIKMYSNEGDTVFTPFLGIGSEVYQALKMDRKGIGIELKPAYFDEAVRNIKDVEVEKHQTTLFDFMQV
ncbi:MAG: site-specific DNA-methyltransferase [Acutalibacteraceae bacterium]|nr:site-specific DNA-methyltransferase [Acutalibacteraceae bacterium]